MASPVSSAQDYDPRFGPPLIAGPVPPGGHGEAVFEIGLVLAGAVSAGAYTGGVIDYLTEALDAFERARAAERARHGDDIGRWTIPGHAVRVKVISGTSAGGMTAAMLAAAGTATFPPIHDAAEARNFGGDNPFFNPWVRRIDISGLLATRDLESSESRQRTVVRSLLDCTLLDDILANVLEFRGSGEQIARGWLGEGTKLCLTITNLRGLPYAFEFPESPGAVYAMTRHADCQRFVLRAPSVSVRHDEIALTAPATPADPHWRALGQAALATGSFPLALAARTILPVPGFYQSTHLVVTGQPPEADDHGVPVAPPRIGARPNWQEATNIVKHVGSVRAADSGQSYASADGGIVDNEPLELARTELAGILGSNPRNPRDATRALLMVYPFPDPPDDSGFHRAEGVGIGQIGLRLISVLLEQARFHPEDIRLALDPDVYSRFMIYPRRDAGPGAPVAGGAALACGALGAFSGFLAEAFRQHDFLLGRANCEAFLRDHFRLPAMVGEERVALFAGQPAHLACDLAGDGIVTRPIIPLCGDIGTTTLDPWPLDAMRPEELAKPIRRRLRAVGTALLGSGLGAGFLKAAWWAPFPGGLLRWLIAGRIVRVIRANLEKARLLTPAAP